MDILIGVTLVAILLFLFKHRIWQTHPKHYKKSMKRTSSHGHHVFSKNSRYHSVSIDSSGHHCRHAEKVKGKRFLSEEAPKIPLGGCNQAHCQCKYIHHADRREPGVDRRLDYGLTHDLYGAFGEQNRRLMTRGRRSTDLQAAH
ncbi:hypothetical protein [Shewanella gelidii]|uniref:Uncharacterized protein n=1 Tax=Shewanella gelidii TaxID=1642821 RepID=A0A917JUI3_9GAMM|nr:hypothetical protein [Shewanella gelidii]MCL1098834.1 hypothetical protein [Shewanella gelidii]GGI87324.1 hypothetical protein GCM10009332_25690 [Shewanella gelidii]